MKLHSAGRVQKAQKTNRIPEKWELRKENNGTTSFKPVLLGTRIERNSQDGTSKVTAFCYGHGKTIIALTAIVVVAIILILILFLMFRINA